MRDSVSVPASSRDFSWDWGTFRVVVTLVSLLHCLSFGCHSPLNLDLVNSGCLPTRIAGNCKILSTLKKCRNLGQCIRLISRLRFLLRSFWNCLRHCCSLIWSPDIHFTQELKIHEKRDKRSGHLIAMECFSFGGFLAALTILVRLRPVSRKRRVSGRLWARASRRSGRRRRFWPLRPLGNPWSSLLRWRTCLSWPGATSAALFAIVNDINFKIVAVGAEIHNLNKLTQNWKREAFASKTTFGDNGYFGNWISISSVRDFCVSLSHWFGFVRKITLTKTVEKETDDESQDSKLFCENSNEKQWSGRQWDMDRDAWYPAGISPAGKSQKIQKDPKKSKKIQKDPPMYLCICDVSVNHLEQNRNKQPVHVWDACLSMI